MKSLMLGVNEIVWDKAAAGNLTSEPFALPAQTVNLSVQYFFTSNPSAFAMGLELSNDGVNFKKEFDLGDKTGECPNLGEFYCHSIRLKIATFADGDDITASFLVKAT